MVPKNSESSKKDVKESLESSHGSTGLTVTARTDGTETDASQSKCDNIGLINEDVSPPSPSVKLNDVEESSKEPDTDAELVENEDPVASKNINEGDEGTENNKLEKPLALAFRQGDVVRPNSIL